MDIFDKCRTTGGYFGEFRARGDHFFSRPILDPHPGRVMTFMGRPVVQWSINNYLGLAGNEEVKRVALEAVNAYGTGAPMGSRMMTGNTERHIALEKALADYCGKESALLFNYGYLGVVGTISALTDENDTILIDKQSHASMIDGTLLSRGKFRIFKHNDMNSLESHLKHVNRTRKGGVLIVTEGVFGMIGELADLPGICALKEQYDARLYLDDAHGFGVMGGEGRGTGTHFDLQDKVDVYFGTFAKAFAAIGGVSASSREVCEWVLYNARSQVFAKSLPMVYVEVLLKTLELIRSDTERRARMWEVAAKLKNGLRELGYNVGDVPSPITAVYVPVGDVRLGMQIIARMRELGVFITGVIYPVVPKGIVLFRMIPTAAHTDEDVAATLDAYRVVRDELKLNRGAGA